MILSTISMLATPGYPAPDIACIVTTCTASRPNRSCRGFNAKQTSYCRAVRIRDDLSSFLAARQIRAQMVVVHFGNQQRDIRIHPMIARIAHDNNTCLLKGQLDIRRDQESNAENARAPYPPERKASTTMEPIGSGRASASSSSLPL